MQITLRKVRSQTGMPQANQYNEDKETEPNVSKIEEGISAPIERVLRC
jgi:hypothetical protein